MAPPVKCDNAIVNLYPDFTLQVQQQRREFLEVKRALRQQELRYAMLFPAKLRVVADGKVHFFTNPDETWQWLEGRDPKRDPLDKPKTPNRKQVRRTERRKTESIRTDASPQNQNSPRVSPNKEQSDRTDWFEATT